MRSSGLGDVAGEAAVSFKGKEEKNERAGEPEESEQGEGGEGVAGGDRGLRV